MKKLLTLFLTLTVLPVPLTFANDDALLEQDLHDYLMFESGTWWDYETTTVDLINGDSTTEESTETQSDCDTTDDCYTVSDGEVSSSIYFEDNTAYYSDMMGLDLSGTYIRMSLETYSQVISSADYEALGFTGLDEGATVLCDSDLEENYEFQNKSYTAIVENCDFNSTIQGTTMRIVTEEVLLKGLGSVSTSTTTYIGSIAFSTINTELTDSSLIVEESPFSDVEITDTNYEAISYLYDEGVFSGYADGTFLPDNTVNRAELIKILVEGTGVTPDEEIYKDCFSDVSTDWYAKYVCYAEEEGWVSGYPDGTFKPADPVNKVEALKMLLLSQGVGIVEEYTGIFEDVNEEDWFSIYVETANELEILEEGGIYFHPDSDKDRKGIAENLYRLLTYETEDL